MKTISSHASAKRRRWCAGVVVLTGVLAALCSPALAGEGEREWGVSAGAANRVETAVTTLRLSGGFNYNVYDLWSVGGLLAVNDRGDVQALATGRLIVDALTWVPSLGVGIGATSEYGGGWIARAHGEIAYRPSRPRSFFLRLFPEIVGPRSAAIQYGLTIGARWHFSDADDLDF